MATSDEFLCGVEGMKILINSPSQPPFFMELNIWEIVEKLNEKASPRFEQEITDGMAPAFVAGKFLCRQIPRVLQVIYLHDLLNKVTSANMS